MESNGAHQAPSHPQHDPSHLVMMMVGALVFLGVGIAVGYFSREPEVRSLRTTASQTTQTKSDAVPGSTPTTVASRDAERKSDINKLGSQLEVYHNNGHISYPNFKNFIDEDWQNQYLLGFNEPEIFRAPGQTTSSLVQIAYPDKDQYGYTPLNADGSICTEDACPKFALYWSQENDGKIHTLKSMSY